MTSFTFTCKQKTRYLIVEATGPWNPTVRYWSPDRVKELIDLVNQRCRQLHYERVLLDMTAVPGEPEYSHRFEIGVYIAQVMPGRPRVAVLARPEGINKFGEDTAVNRGAVLLVTGDRNEAITWLLEGAPPEHGP
jgi:hypothetical protein